MWQVTGMCYRSTSTLSWIVITVTHTQCAYWALVTRRIRPQLHLLPAYSHSRSTNSTNLNLNLNPNSNPIRPSAMPQAMFAGDMHMYHHHDMVLVHQVILLAGCSNDSNNYATNDRMTTSHSHSRITQTAQTIHSRPDQTQP